MPLNGFDIASVNGPGIITRALTGSFVIAKASEGATWTDPQHDSFVAQARAAGKLVGHYHYAHCENNTAAVEAAHFLAAAKPKPGDVLALDFEPYKTSGGFSCDPAGWPEWVLAFVAAINRATGAACWLYLDGNVGTHLEAAATVLQLAQLHDIPLWKAAYSSTSGDLFGWPALTCWQFSSAGIDQDTFYGTPQTWAALAVPTPNSKEWWQMPLDAQAKADVAAVVTDVLKNAGVVPASSGTGSYSLGLIASTTNVYAAAARDNAAQAVAQIGALTGIVQALAKAQGQALTADQITAAAQAGAKAALDERIAGAQVNLNVTPAGGAS